MTAVIEDLPRTIGRVAAAACPRIVLVPCEPTAGVHVLELLRLARVIRERGGFDIAFCIDAHGRERRRLAGIVGDAGFPVLDLEAAPEAPRGLGSHRYGEPGGT